ncbi:MAG: hypothetical protein NVSMB5_03280 [Candidatus Velthaea sp.]
MRNGGEALRQDSGTAQPSLEQVYEVATQGRPREIAAALALFSNASRIRDPLAIALRGVQNALSGDVPGGVALLGRAIDQADARTRQYLTELLTPYLLTTVDVEWAARALDRAGDPVDELVPAFLGLRAVIAARQGRDTESRELAVQANQLARAGDNPIIGARVMQRTSLAAYYREDFAEAKERALEAARAFERIAAPRYASMSYSILYVIAHDWSGDPDAARFYAERLTMSAALAEDAASQNYGLVAQLEVAAEAGDHRRLGSIRARLLAGQLHEQYRERISLVISEALLASWSGKFELARMSIGGFVNASATRSLPEQALCDAFLCLIDLAQWDIDSAKERAHRVISNTVHHERHEPLFDGRRRRIARILAATACLIMGETTRGRRALSRAFDPDEYFARTTADVGLDEALAPPLLRGYARLINATCAAAASRRPKHGLTPAEVRVLRALPEGVSLSELAATFGKSKKTIERQVGSIYEKLEVSNRAQAIQRARDLGLHA